MSRFVAAVNRLSGRFELDAPVAEAFPLFSPQGERGWVPGWSPEMLHPGEERWERGQIFRTIDAEGEVVWVISRLDETEHTVEYHRVEPGRYVARVEVRCRGIAPRRTEVSTEYAYVGLSEQGNREIESMSQEAYDAKMTRWAAWIGEHLERTAGTEGGVR